MKFVAAEYDETGRGVEAELTVWDRLKRCFTADDIGVCYYRFPIVDQQNNDLDREADFVVLHRKYGLVVIECKGYKIDHIRSIEGAKWTLSGISQDTAAPYSQARDHGFRLRSPMMRERSLVDERGNCDIVMTPIVALPNVTRAEWKRRGFDTLPSTPRVILQDDLSKVALRDVFESLPGDDVLTRSQYEDARAVLGGGQAISGERGPVLADRDTKAGLYETVEKGLKRFDDRQEEIGVQIPDGPQQIRGIAGSGKTALLARKAAAMHVKHPNWKIAVTFNTRSLYQTIRDSIRNFYADFGGKEPDWDRLEVLHGWGGKREHGMYYKIAQDAGVSPHHVGSAQDAFGDGSPGELLESCCQQLVDDAPIQERYDAILIDEAQDMEPSFYKMCYEALKPPKRLIWAYDEAQNLTSLSAPSPKRIFGTNHAGEPAVDLSGSYTGGIQKSQIMRKSYRTPRSVLLLAHGFGMGLTSDRGAVQAITTQEGWEDIGYEVLEGDFRRTGEPVSIRRPQVHSPHPLSDDPEAKPFVGFDTFERKEDELNAVADAIAVDVKEHGLEPEHVLAIPLGSITDIRSIGQRLTDLLAERSVDGNLVWDGNKSVFAEQGAVTISGINRAKGNEAASVYLLNLEYLENPYWHDNRVSPRNEAFVGLTRTRAWCQLTGTGSGNGIFRELNQLITAVTDEDPVLTFPAPNPTNLENEIGNDETIATSFDQF
ncbi:NERD domain-containing protein [Halostagnicola kamekurae]|uniref:Superfamily I DNA and RNA helicases n=1 Tax=Halostagnicola kamekurae TaxID=619731 RepID=A0A1I6RVB1_9EURY|nr:nuclease-related domain-containing DEAD/DEAH box helicase [Halostagnicola kamekurae]SFS68647.1 Superfamily I DNA and RNA helicases [Halostagnicola kamekurae]